MDLTVLLLYILILIPSVYLLQIYAKWKQISATVNKIPGPKAYFLIGTTWVIFNTKREKLFETFREMTAQFGSIFRTFNGFLPEIHLLKAEYLELIANSTKHLQKGIFYDYLHPWLGTGLLTSFGARWHSHRKLITPAFHFKILESYFDIFVIKSQKLVEQLKPKANGQVFDIFPFITHCALDIICETAMGVELNAMDKPNSDYVSAVYDISTLILQRAIKPWFRSDFIYYNFSSQGQRYKKCITILHNFTNNVIKERKREFLKLKKLNPDLSEDDLLLGRKKRLAFLDLLIEASDGGTKLSDSDIREEVDTFMFEGHDTTTAGICFALFCLGNYPDIQNKVFEELEGIFGDDVNRSITLHDLNEMKYLERVIKESLRLYPSVPFISRRLSEDITIDGYLIPKDCMVTLHIYDAHRDPKQFPNPEVFNPDNFLPERCQQRHPYAYIPFSAGARNCIGQKFALMEEKTVIASIVRKYKVKSMQKPEDMKYYSELILRPQTGILVQLEPRK